jgi:transglutaminase-like putative cysteine protease
MLRPRSGGSQWVASERYELEPFTQATEYVDGFGNLCQRIVAPAGSFKIVTEVVVETADSILVNRGGPVTEPANLPDNTLLFLLPSRYCPADKLRAQALEVTAGAAPGYDQVEAIRAWINSNIEYRYGVSNESTSAVETLADKAGVCRDFSHIGISLCRALHIPARMVVGYLYLKGTRAHLLSEIQYRILKWRINRMRRKFDVHPGGRAKDFDRLVH